MIVLRFSSDKSYEILEFDEYTFKRHFNLSKFIFLSVEGNHDLTVYYDKNSKENINYLGYYMRNKFYQENSLVRGDIFVLQNDKKKMFTSNEINKLCWGFMDGENMYESNKLKNYDVDNLYN